MTVCNEDQKRKFVSAVHQIRQFQSRLPTEQAGVSRLKLTVVMIAVRVTRLIGIADKTVNEPDGFFD
jgi:hypothetical protein